MNTVVSIIICTRNRGDSLRETLASISGCQIPADLPAELLVIDNGSTDGTKSVVQQTNMSNMPLRYTFEGQNGKCHAHNRGMAEANGEVFLWTDDDVRVPADWIERMCRPIVSGEVDAMQSGIKMAPHLRKPWLTRALAGILLDWTPDRVESPTLVGANMAFAKQVRERVPFFDPDLGPGARGYYDDTLFGMQLVEAGYKIGFTPDAVVEHHFDESRLQHLSFLVGATAIGRSSAYVMHHWHHQTLPKLWLRLFYNLMKLGFAKFVRFFASRDSAPISLLEREMTYRFALCRELIRFRGEPRHYVRHGLVRIDADGSSMIRTRETCQA